MRKTIALGLIFVFLFNIAGYYGFYLAMRHQIRAEMTRQLDEGNFSLDQAITFKIPLSLPYPHRSNDAGRINGDFEFNGEFFKLVKQRLENDTLYVVLVKNHEERRLVASLTDYLKLAIDQTGSSKHTTLKLLGSLAKDFAPGTVRIEISPCQDLLIEKYFASSVKGLPAPYFSVFSPPPEFVG